MAAFIATVIGLHRFDLYTLRGLDVTLSDDIMACMDGIRWGKCHVADSVPDGFARAHLAAAQWGYAA